MRFQTPIEHGRQTPELLADHLCLLDQRFKNPILRPLCVEEVMAAHLSGSLELPVNATVALLQAARVPWHVEVEEIRAVVLQVHALARRLGGNQHTKRMLRRGTVERALHLFARLVHHAAVEGRNEWVALSRREVGSELLLQVAFRIAVLREDEDALVFVRARPLHEVLHPRVGLSTRRLGNLGHLREERALAGVRIRSSCRNGERARSGSLHSCGLLLSDFFLSHIRAIVIRIRSVEQVPEAGCARILAGLGWRLCLFHHRPRGVGFEGFSMDLQRARERLHG